MANEKSFLTRFIDGLASYWLASFLLFCLFLLTLFGTLAQVHDGIYLAQKKYFESWYVFHHAGPVVIPLLGGMTCMSMLAINLLLGGLVRIRKNKNTYGVIVIHVGIAVMLAAALVKQKASDDGYLKLYEGESSDEFVHFYDWEVAIFDASVQTGVEERIIPDDHLTDLVDGKTRTFELPDLGVELELSNFVINSRVLPKGPNWSTPYPTIDGYAVRELDFDGEAAERNLASMYVKARATDSGESTEGILWVVDRYPWTFEAKGKRWAVSLRHKRLDMPFSISLDKFTRELHPRTGIPKVFSSEVTKLNTETKNAQKVEISMNEPLRSGGLVLFQSSWGPANAKDGDALFSQFSVVRNPSDAWPLYSCIIISIGLLMTFGQKLSTYVQRQNKERSKALASEATS